VHFWLRRHLDSSAPRWGRNEKGIDVYRNPTADYVRKVQTRNFSNASFARNMTFSSCVELRSIWQVCPSWVRHCPSL
jgi:hypothetical protein